MKGDGGENEDGTECKEVLSTIAWQSCGRAGLSCELPYLAPPRQGGGRSCRLSREPTVQETLEGPGREHTSITVLM